MANCSYGPNGAIPRDASFISGLSSKNIIGCTSKYNTVEANDVTVNDLLTSKTIYDSANVKYYGVVGDGVTDDTVAFQRALDEGPGCMILPPGNYIVTTISVPVGKRLIGCPRSSTISFSGDLGVDLLGGAYLQDVTLAYTGSNTTTSVGINMGGVNSVIGVTVNGTLGTGIEAAASSTFITGCSIFGGSDVGIDVTSGGGTGSIQITDCLIQAVTACIRTVLNNNGISNIWCLGTGATVAIDFGGSTGSTAVNIINGGGLATPPFTNTGPDTFVTVGGIVNTSGAYSVDGLEVVRARGAAVADAAGGATVDTEARAAINALLARMRATGGHGLIAD